MDPYITKDDLLNSHVGIDFSVYDNGADDETNYLNTLCLLATEIVDKFTGRSFTSGTYTQNGQSTTDTEGNLFVQLKNFPVKEITSLKVRNRGYIDWIPLELNMVDLRADKGYLYYNTSTKFERIITENRYYLTKKLGEIFTYEVEYTTELADDIPPLIKHACVIIAGELIKVDLLSKATGTPAPSGEITSFMSGNYSVNFGEKASKNSQFQGYNGFIPPHAQFLLSQYKRVRQSTF